MTKASASATTRSAKAAPTRIERDKAGDVNSLRRILRRPVEPLSASEKRRLARMAALVRWGEN